MWNQEDPLDAGRFLLHQGGWDNKSALERYNPVHDPDFGRVGGPYGGRGFPEAGFPRDNGYSRGGFPRDLLMEGDRFQMGPPPVLGMWPPGRRATLEEELALIRGPQRHVKVGYVDGYDSYRDVDFREADSFRDANNFRDADKFRDIDNYREVEKYRDYGFDRTDKYANPERHDYDGEDYAFRRPAIKSSREGSWEREHAHSRYDDFDSDPDKEKRERSRRKSKKRDKERRRSKDRDDSPERGRRRERSRSHGHDHRSRRSRSSSRSHARDKRERSYDDDYYESHHDKKRSKDDKRTREQFTVAPSATVVVRWLSQNTVEDDLYQALAEWGPLRHVRVIKERNTGVSRGFAFVDFPSVDSARKMMEAVGENGLVLHGRRLFFEYSSKPTGGLGGPQASSTDLATGSTTNSSKGTSAVLAVDWMCTVCGCVNFARRTSCFQCNEGRTDDAPPADISIANSSTGKKGSEAGPTHVLVVRGLDNNVNEEILHYEFSKYAPIKDLRLVRDKFTHISRGFAFVHFHSVEDATKALESSNGTTLEKNGQPLRVAYAKSIHGPPPSSSASSSLAAAAIEAATFAQQYNAAGWAPKEYNPDQVSTSEVNNEAAAGSATDTSGAPQAGFVWDEASGYYYDAVSGFYYDGHRGLYYDGNNRIWYSYNQVTQQYEPYVEQTADASADTSNQKPNTKSSDGTIKTNTGTTSRKAVISAPPATIHKEPELFEKKMSAAEAIKAAAAAAAQTTTKKEKEKMKEKERELRLSCKNLLPSSKTKISGVSTMWKQKPHESQVTIIDQQSASSATASSFLDDKSKNIAAKATSGTTNSGQMSSAAPVTTGKKIQGVIHTKQTLSRAVSEDASLLDKQKPIPATSNLLAATGTGMTPPMKKLEGVIRSKEISGNGQSAGNSFGGDYRPADDSLKARQSSMNSTNVGAFDAGDTKVIERGSNVDVLSRVSSNSLNASITPFRTDASALGSYGPQAGGRRRFTEAPQPGYRDRAAERRNLHGASLPGDV